MTPEKFRVEMREILNAGEMEDDEFVNFLKNKKEEYTKQYAPLDVQYAEERKLALQRYEESRAKAITSISLEKQMVDLLTQIRDLL